MQKFTRSFHLLTQDVSKLVNITLDAHFWPPVAKGTILLYAPVLECVVIMTELSFLYHEVLMDGI